MPAPDDPLARFYRETSFKPLNPVWAKVEIGLGLLAVGFALFLLARGPAEVPYLAAGILLFVLGGYLTLAGHRSHLYQSNNRLAAYLAELIRQKPRDNP